MLGIAFAVGYRKVSAHAVSGENHLVQLLLFSPCFQGFDKEIFGVSDGLQCLFFWSVDVVVVMIIRLNGRKGRSRGGSPSQEIQGMNVLKIAAQCMKIAIKIDTPIHISVQEDEGCLNGSRCCG